MFQIDETMFIHPLFGSTLANLQTAFIFRMKNKKKNGVELKRDYSLINKQKVTGNRRLIFRHFCGFLCGAYRNSNFI